ncbi:MAG: hypothetical protein ACR5KV_00610 [Wolbachia sp.]
MNSNCINIPPDSLCTESYDALQSAKGDWYENCKNHIFADDAHVVSGKVSYYKNTINKDKPIAVDKCKEFF